MLCARAHMCVFALHACFCVLLCMHVCVQLEDRRLVLEKMMASLKVQNQQLKEKYNMEKQLNNKYKVNGDGILCLSVCV